VGSIPTSGTIEDQSLTRIHLPLHVLLGLLVFAALVAVWLNYRQD